MPARSGDLSVYLPGGVVLPPDLDAALREDRLVVFVGAGASRDLPARLPDFRELTEEVLALAGSSEPPAEDGRYDSQLGDLEDNGFDVRKAVRQVIIGGSSRPSRLHEAVTGLFPSADRARIVTTNYDGLLETALGGTIEVWSAPALPLGDSFRGVVHLHGSVNGPDEGLVVTDRDFGRAYLTQGWARRFLVTLFHHFYVLFVGYSHRDVDMRYLARGLPPDSRERRFALVKSGTDTAEWKRYRIQPIEWASDAGDPYEPEVEALQAWGQEVRLSELEHTARIQRLVAGGRQLDPVDESYLTRALDIPPRATVFARVASGEVWLQWAAHKSTFRALFDPNTTLTPAQAILAEWFARTYVITGIGNPLNLLAVQDGQLSAGLWMAVAHALWRPGPQGPDILEPWIAILCQQDGGHNPTVLNYLLNDCQLPNDRGPLVLLLRHLFEPKLELKPGIPFPGFPPSTSADIAVAADPYWVDKTLNETIKPNIGDIAQDLYEVATSVLSRYFELHSAFGEVHGGHDPISRMRHAVESHRQNQYGDDATLAVDLAREAASALASSRGALAIADDLLTREVPILRRLAAWIVAEA